MNIDFIQNVVKKQKAFSIVKMWKNFGRLCTKCRYCSRNSITEKAKN